MSVSPLSERLAQHHSFFRNLPLSSIKLVGDHFLYTCDINVWFRGDIIRRYKTPVILKGPRVSMASNAPFNSQDLISNSPYCLPNDSHYVSLENVVLNQFVIPWLIFFFNSHHFSAQYCIDLVRRNSVLVTHGS